MELKHVERKMNEVSIKVPDYESKYQIAYLRSLLENIADSLIPDEKKRVCPICKSKVNSFLPFGVKVRENAQCPVCRSLERHRALWMFIQKRKVFARGGRLLHFAPEEAFYDRFVQMENIDYWPVDIDKTCPRIRKTVDITDIPFPNESFDFIVCNHVLEHVEDEKKALCEIWRVLSPTGIAFLNVPVHNRETTLEKPEYNTPELRFKYYGQDDHVRLYGKDYPKRLESAGFVVEIVEFGKGMEADQLKKYGLLSHEIIYIATKL